MIVTPCPRCQETFRLPIGSLPEDAQAICPWCQEKFALSEVLEHLPPILGVVGADGSPIAFPSPMPQEGFGDLNSQISDVAESSVDSDSESWADLTIDDREAATESPVAENWNAGGSNSLTALDQPESVSQEPILMRVPGRHRKKSSGIRTAIGVVLGGLAALPIAGGLLMLMGKTPDWGFWPFDGGKQDSGSGVVAAPMGNLGGRSDDRPFGQSLMRSEQAPIAPDPSDAVLESILKSNQSTSPADADTSDAANYEETFPLLRHPSIPDDDKEPVLNPTDESVESNSAGVFQSAPQFTTTSTLDAITVLNPDFDGDRDSNPASVDLEERKAAATVPTQIASIERPSSSFTLPTESTSNANDSIEMQPAPTETLNVSDDAFQLPAETEVALESVLPESDSLSDSLMLDDAATSDTTTPDSTDLDVAETGDSLAKPALDSSPEANALELPAEFAASTEIPAETLEIPTETLEIPTETLEIPTETLEIPTETLEVAGENIGADPTDAQPERVLSELPSREPDSLDNDPTDSAALNDPGGPEAIVNPTEAAKDLVNRLTTFDGAKQERRVLLRDTYLKVAEICNDAPTSTEGISNLAKTIAKSSIVDEIEMAGLDWIQYGRRKFDGVAVIGQITQSNGKTTLSLSNGNSLTLTQVNQLPSKTKVLTLGRIVDGSTVKVLAVEPIQ